MQCPLACQLSQRSWRLLLSLQPLLLREDWHPPRVHAQAVAKQDTGATELLSADAALHAILQKAAAASTAAASLCSPEQLLLRMQQLRQQQKQQPSRGHDAPLLPMWCYGQAKTLLKLRVLQQQQQYHKERQHPQRFWMIREWPLFLSPCRKEAWNEPSKEGLEVKCCIPEQVALALALAKAEAAARSSGVTAMPSSSSNSVLVAGAVQLQQHSRRGRNRRDRRPLREIHPR
ncbi:hypothetical protein cyc_02750 [Cyclospora cayetanensis]|uniref:Uncharacterized protein n=1 Tax=Cyclospora cayetanensis TaxID=88456 RepID=A0A1D3CU26_9EIME|nr:hypothetical protein cyc_02750 [Cyclospora cayetanensis]